MGTFLRSGFGSWPNPNATWIPFAPKVDGQFQVSTARNVAMTPPGSTTEAPGPYFQKEFFHNGYAKSLKQIVHFLQYSRRVSVPRHLGTLAGRKNGKSGLLADARSHEQSRHDGRQSRLDGSGGEPDRQLPANPYGRFHDTFSQHQYLYGYVQDRRLGVDARE